MRNKQIDTFANSFPLFAQPLLRHPDWIHQYPRSDTVQLIIILICYLLLLISVISWDENTGQSHHQESDRRPTVRLKLAKILVAICCCGNTTSYTHTHTQRPAAFFSPSFLLISQFWSSVNISVSDFRGQQSQRSNSHKPGTSTTKA